MHSVRDRKHNMSFTWELLASTQLSSGVTTSSDTPGAKYHTDNVICLERLCKKLKLKLNLIFERLEEAVNETQQHPASEHVYTGTHSWHLHVCGVTRLASVYDTNNWIVQGQLDVTFSLQGCDEALLNPCMSGTYIWHFASHCPCPPPLSFVPF